MDDSTVLELIPAYTLGALDEAERAQVEALLTRSPAARQLLLEYEQVLGGLALTVPARRAPTGSTDAFMARLQQAERGSTESDRHATPVPKPPARTAAKAAETARRRLPVWALAAAALVILAAAVGIWRLTVGNGLTPSSEVAAINAIKSDPAVRVVALKPTDPNASPALSVNVYGTPAGTDAVVDRASLPALPSGKQYQLWMIPNGQSPVGLPAFDSAPANQPDQAELLVHLPGPMGSYQVVALTIEPSGGSPQPTSKPIAMGNVGA